MDYGQTTGSLSTNDTITTKSAIPDMGRDGRYSHSLSGSTGQCRHIYYWRPRFEVGGYEALEQFASHAPQEPNRTSVEIEREVIALRRQNDRWGKQRIAAELAKKNNWIPVISPNTVKRVLQDAGLWPPPEPQSTKAKFEPVSRTAEMPGQSLNVDLCFVPADHENEVKLPAVSGSSGRLVVERVKSKAVEADHPGVVFANEQLDYA